MIKQRYALYVFKNQEQILIGSINNNLAAWRKNFEDGTLDMLQIVDIGYDFEKQIMDVGPTIEAHWRIPVETLEINVAAKTAPRKRKLYIPIPEDVNNA